MLVLFFMIFVAILFWAIPWLPYGLSVEDYNDRLSLLLALMLMASLTAFGAVYHRDLGRRVEQTLLTWTSVHDGLSDRRRREYFYDRVVIEGERAKSSQSQFTVVALRLEDGDDDGQSAEQVLGQIAPSMEDSNFLAILGPREIGVLAPRINGQQAAAFAERVRSLIATTSSPPSQVRAGWAIFGVDGKEAGSLVGLARERVLGRGASPYGPEGTTDYRIVA